MDRIHTRVLVIGCGVAGICLSARLKTSLGCEDIHIYDRNAGPGGVWHRQKYPGVACDIPADFYSFSFFPGNGWSKFRPDGREYETYIHDVVTEFDLWHQITFLTECEEAVWDADSSLWIVTLKDIASGRRFQHSASVFCAAVGTLVVPKVPCIDGLDTFSGPVIHTSEWNDKISLDGKRVAVFGNGASGSQLVPQILPSVSSLLHVARSPVWYLPATQIPYGENMKWVLKTVPMTRRFLRLLIGTVAEFAFRASDLSGRALGIRSKWAENALEYMNSVAPSRYHTQLEPDHEMGCKRPVFDSGYLQSLHDPRMSLVTRPKITVSQTAVKADDTVYPVDVIILATGYTTNDTNVCYPRIKGLNDTLLNDHWREQGGPSAYATLAVHGFPNMFLIKGPNTGTGHTSSILVTENVVNLALKAMGPVVVGTARVVEVTKDAEMEYTHKVQETSRGKVWLSGCDSWYVSATGWNGAIYPWSQVYCWWSSVFPNWKDWKYSVH